MKAREIFETNFNRAEELLKLHKSAQPKGRPALPSTADDILRAAIVFASAALDSYMHKRTEEVVARIILEKGRVPIKCIAHLLRTIPKDPSNSGNEGRVAKYFIELGLKKAPHKKLVNLITKVLAGETFQDVNQIDHALDIMEVANKKRWATIGLKMRSKHSPAKYLKGLNPKQFLNDLYEERTRTVHVGGLYTSKKHHGKIRKISRTHVDQVLKKLRRVVDAIEAVTA